MRDIFLSLFIFLAAIPVASGQHTRSALYPADWQPGHADGEGRFLHDFSYAGYRNGAALPLAESAAPTFDVLDFGADNTGASDASAAIRQAIFAAQVAGGGTVWFPQGLYRCDDYLIITASNIILRGEGPAATRIYFSFVPTILPQSHILFWSEITYSAEALLVEDAPNQSFSIHVADASAYAVGDEVAVGWVITEAFVAEHGMTGTWGPFNGQWVPVFRREIVAIDRGTSPETLYFDVPLRYPAKMRDSASVRIEQGYLDGCAVRDMALSNSVDRESAWSQNQSILLGMFGVKDSYMFNVHSFESPLAVDTEEKHLQSIGIRLMGTKRITVAECVLEKAQHRGSGGNGYLYEVLQSNEILFRDCVARDGRHNFIQNWGFGATGIVWLRCDSAGSTSIARFGTFDIATRAYSEYHHSLAMACLVDSCVFSDGWFTGNRDTWSSGAGHTATETVLWNTRGRDEARLCSFNYGHGYVIGTENIEVHVAESSPFSYLFTGTEPVDYAEMIGEASSLFPASLYESQRRKRLNLPEASFRASPLAGVAPLTVAFTDTSLPNGAAIEMWHWDFGDGATSELQHPEHTYLVPGVYDVTLVVSTALGEDAWTCASCVVASAPMPVADSAACAITAIMLVVSALWRMRRRVRQNKCIVPRRAAAEQK